MLKIILSDTKRDMFFLSSLLIIILLSIVLIWIFFLPMILVPKILDSFVTFSFIPVSIISLGIFGNIAYATQDCKKKNRWMTVGIITILAISCFFWGAYRVDARVKLEWECNGTIKEKYLSHSHAMRSMFIEGILAFRMEGIADSFYDQAKVGDRIVKKKWDQFALLNGQPVKIVEGCYGPMFCFLTSYQKQR